MLILMNHYAIVMSITEGSLGRTMFQYRTLYMGNTAHRTATERDIADMRNVIVRHRKGLIAEDSDEEAHTEVENMSVVVV